MKNRYKLFLIIVCLVSSAFHCSSSTELTDVYSIPTAQWYIRPFGDSITYGVGFAPGCGFPPTAAGGGYRGWMTAFAQSPAVGLKFKTVGNRFDGSNLQQWNLVKGYPNSACTWGSPFKQPCTQFHDGFPGWRTDQLMGIATIKIKEPQPHVALIHAGTNDFLQGFDADTAWANLQQIMRNMRAARGNNKTKLVVAQILRVADWYTNPFTKCHADCVNAQIKKYNEHIAFNVNDPTWPNSSNVDMGSVGFLSKDQYVKDGIHPNCRGYVKMACTWLTQIGRNAPSTCSDPAALCKNLKVHNRNKNQPMAHLSEVMRDGAFTNPTRRRECSGPL